MVEDKRKTSSKPLTAAPRLLSWGEPPLALLPASLAQRLDTIPLPDWLANALGARGASVTTLQAGVWERLPEDPEIRGRARAYVLDLVSAHALELDDVTLGGNGVRSMEELTEWWPARPRNACAAAADRVGLATLTFGDLLDTRNVGVRIALEAAALLDFFPRNAPATPGADSSAPMPRLTIPRWSKPGSPLLPATLRRALADEVLPKWLVSDLHLPEGANPLSLDASPWRRLDALPIRVGRYLMGLLTYRADDLARIRVLDGTWPADLDPADVPWPRRVRTSLERADLIDPKRLQFVTYGELLAIPAMGVKTVLEFAAMADAVVSAPSRTLDEVTRNSLLQAAETGWAERVQAADPRFRDVVPPFAGTLAELFEDALTDPEGPRAWAIAEALPQIRERVKDIGAEPIDLALTRLLKSLGVSDRNSAIVRRRLGWTGRPPLSLRETGHAFNLSGESVRQIEGRVRKRIDRTYLPQIQRAVDLLTDRAPLRPDDAARLLQKEGLSTVPIHPSALAEAANLLGYEVSFQIDLVDGQAYVVAQGASGAGPVFKVARRQAGRVGVSNVQEVQAELELRGQPWAAEVLSRVLHSSDRVQFLHDDWFWMPGIGPYRNRLRNVSRRMLSVTPRLDVPTLRQGVRRRYRFMHIDSVPPVSVLAAFYAAHPEFVLHADDTVSSAQPLDYREELGDVEEAFVDVLRGSPTGLMDRAQLDEAVTGMGVNANTFSVFTTYSPILDHPATNIWSLRGQPIDPTELEALRGVLATRTRRRRTLAYGWDEDGTLQLTVEVSDVGSPVVGIPSAIARYVAGRHFRAVTQDGVPAGTIAIDEGGTSWGYGPFMRRRGGEPGDALTVRFDLVAEIATLVLGDEAPLQEPD
jgi:hypothetical protein